MPDVRRRRRTPLLRGNQHRPSAHKPSGWSASCFFSRSYRYGAWSYWVFRRKVQTDIGYH